MKRSQLRFFGKHCNWPLILHQGFLDLPEPTGRNWFVTSNTFMDRDKFIPFCNVGTLRRSLQWPETTPGTLHKPLGLRQPMPNRARWAGQMVISKKFNGSSKHPHLAKISSTSVWTPENFKNLLCFCISLLHWVSGMMEVEELLRSSAPQTPPAILKNEHDICKLYPSSDNLGFFWGKCVVYFDKEVIFTFRGNTYLLLASSTTYGLTYVIN